MLMSAQSRKHKLAWMVWLLMGAVVLLRIFDQSWGPRVLAGSLSFFLLVTLVLLWSSGVQRAGDGWRRYLFLTTYAAPMVFLLLNWFALFDLASSAFVEGYDLGARMANEERAAKGLPPKLHRWGAAIESLKNPSHKAFPWLSWTLLTALAVVLLDRLERRGAEAERQQGLAKEAKAQAMAARLAPHFIFNTLNTLHAQIEVDPKAAQVTTERLADLFRQVVSVAGLPSIPLKQELAFVEAYLGIEQVRLGERLCVTLQLPENLETGEIPPLSLQVLVENAIKHGVAPLEMGGEVRIGAERRDGFLHLWVEDPGPGFSSQQGTGTALSTLRQRLDRPEDLEMGLVNGRHRVSFRWRQA
jgi:hypothetical protein